MKREKPKFGISGASQRVVICKAGPWVGALAASLLESSVTEGESPVCGHGAVPVQGWLEESDCLGMQSKTGGKLHPRLNISKRPIAKKYREGKMKRTLKREFNST